jgi:hypothetical protein
MSGFAVPFALIPEIRLDYGAEEAVTASSTPSL